MSTSLIDHCAPQLIPIRLNLPLYNMKSYKLRSLYVSGPRLWNELPSELRVIESIIIFKAKLKTHLFKAHFT